MKKTNTIETLKLSYSYYQNHDVLFLAKDLIGKVLCTQIDGKTTSGIIVETEAYMGALDKASHAYGHRRTNRTETLYSHGGVSYVYLCYGIHYLFNIVTASEDEPHAVLIRALEPLTGIDVIENRRNLSASNFRISSGPGSVAKALGIDMRFNKKSLDGDEIWVEDHAIRYNENQIASVPRVGVGYADEYALLPWRFFLKGNNYVSKPNKI